MQFEWDDEKAEANLAKHGVSFEIAVYMDWDGAVTFPQLVRGEDRVAAYLTLDDRLFFCVYVIRDG